MSCLQNSNDGYAFSFQSQCTAISRVAVIINRTDKRHNGITYFFRVIIPEAILLLSKEKTVSKMKKRVSKESKNKNCMNK